MASWAGPGPPWLTQGGAGRLAQHTRTPNIALPGRPALLRPPGAPPGLCLQCSRPRNALPGGKCGPTCPPRPAHGRSPGGPCVSPGDAASLPPLLALLTSGVKLVLVHVHVTSCWLKDRVPASPPPPNPGRLVWRTGLAAGAFPNSLLPPASVRPSGKVSSSVCTGPLAQRSLPSPPRHPNSYVLCRPEAARLLHLGPEHVLSRGAEMYRVGNSPHLSAAHFLYQ